MTAKKKTPAKKTQKTETRAPSSYAKKFGASGNTGKPHETEQTAELAEAPAEPKPTTPTDAPADQQPEPTPVATTGQAETPKGKQPRAKKEKPAPKPKKLSAIDAAAQVLAEAGQPMNCLEMIDAMGKEGLWSSPGGQTPHATLYSAILREIAKKGKESRFTKTERGRFATA
jgi:hypothetical protein